MSLRVTALGTGDAFSAERWSSCFLVEHAASDAARTTTRVLIDCPHPIRRVLRSSTLARTSSGEVGPIDVGDIDAVILTHLHGDHASGLEGFGWFNHFALQRRTKLYAWRPVLDGVWPMLQASMGELLHVDDDNRPHHRTRLVRDDLFECFELSLDEPVAIGPLRVRMRPTLHHIPTTALRIDDDDGACFGFSGDTAFDPSLIAWLSSADVIFHETNFGAHTPLQKLLALPDDVRARLHLYHWPDGFEHVDGPMRVLRDGDVVDVQARGQRDTPRC